MALKNFVLGRGEVYLANHDADENPMNWRYVGATRELNLTAETEDLEHVNSDAGINEVDARVQLSVTRSGTMIMEDIQPDNLALFLFGEAAARDGLTDATGAAGSDVQVETGDEGDFPERAIFLGVVASNPVGHRNVSSVVLTPVPATALVKDTDYEVDDSSGRILFIDTGTVRLLTQVSVAYDYAEDNAIEIKSGTTPFTGAMKFIEFNPEGDNNDWSMPKVQLSPNGDLSLKAEEWRQVPFTVSVQSPAAATVEALYINGAPARM